MKVVELLWILAAYFNQFKLHYGSERCFILNFQTLQDFACFVYFSKDLEIA